MGKEWSFNTYPQCTVHLVKGHVSIATVLDVSVSSPFVLMQGRDKERLFEEELEVVWEKGGSGLVFYTDSAYWQEKEGGRRQLLLNI